MRKVVAGLRVLAVQGVGVLCRYDHDSKVLRQWRCDPALTFWPQFFAGVGVGQRYG